MDTTLAKIKRLILRRQYRFTLKADIERARDGLSRQEVLEAIMNANGIRKVIRSRRVSGDRLYVIESFTYDGVLVYTKGVIKRRGVEEVFYLLVSSKRSAGS